MDKSGQDATNDMIEMLEELERRHPGIPVIWHDQQGLDLCELLRTEFPRSNGFHQGLAFRQGDQWRRGTHLSFYSSLDRETQNQIANRVRQLVESNAYCPVLLEYFEIEDQHRSEATPFATIQVGEGEAVRVPNYIARPQ